MLKGMHAEVHVTLLCNKVQKIQFSYMQIFLPHTNTCIWWPTCISINNVWQLLITCGTEAFCRGQWVDYRPQQTAYAQTWPRCDQTFCRIRHAQASVSGRKWHAGCLKKKIENKTILSPLSDTLNYTGHCGCIYLLYLSMLGRLISSQNRTSHLFICMGDSTTPLGVRLYSQYWSNVFSSSSGVVALEKFRPTTCQGEKIIIQNIQITVESKNMYSKINGNIHSYTSSPKCTIIQVGNHNSSLFILNSLYQNISHSK